MIVSGEGTLINVEIYDIISHSGSSHGVIIYENNNIGATNIRLRNYKWGGGGGGVGDFTGPFLSLDYF